MSANDNSDKYDSADAKNYKPVVYVLDDAGNYIKSTREIYEPATIALKQLWDSINENSEIQKKRAIAGEISPLAYYIEKKQMSIKRISHMTDIPTRKIKKHLNPEVFKTLNANILDAYASTFNITVDELINIK